MSRILLCALLTGLMSACEAPDGDSRRTRDAIETLNAEVIRAANTLDARRLMEYFARDTGLIVVGDGRMVVGWDTVLGAQRESWADLFRATYDVERTQVNVLAPDIAIVINTGSALEVPRIGEQRRGHFVSTVVWQRREGDWRIIHVHESTSP